MTLKKWTAVEKFLTDQLVDSDQSLEAALKASSAAGLPAINVTPGEGKLLWILARSVKARSILEIGTLGGYSTIWLARALPAGGRVVTLELEPKHAEVARRNVARAGLSEKVEVRVGPALASLEALRGEHGPPFDLVFVDADKTEYPAYVAGSAPICRSGSLLVIDNVVRRGDIVQPASPDPLVQGVQRTFERIGRDPRMMATAIQTVGSKGHDGFLLARFEAGPP
jgi:predicted O-methyltransferase YrrM